MDRQLLINGEPVKNYRLGKTDHCGNVEVFTNNNSSRHWLPVHFMQSKPLATIRTSGNRYTWK